MSDLVIPVAAAVVSQGEQLLVCLRPDTKRHGGLWEFPGGKCEHGESLADAIRRELCEELGVEVISVGAEQYSMRDPGSAFLIVFVPVQIEGRPQCNEHAALHWGQPTDLLRLPLAPADRSYLQWLVG